MYGYPGGPSGVGPYASFYKNMTGRNLAHYFMVSPDVCRDIFRIEIEQIFRIEIEQILDENDRVHWPRSMNAPPKWPATTAATERGIAVAQAIWHTD